MNIDWKGTLKRLGGVEKTFCVLLVLYFVLALTWPGSVFTPLTQLVLGILGIWIAVRLIRKGMRKVIWRLRNRLLVTYLFIAVVPVFLIVVLAGLGAYVLISQLAVYMATSDLERRAATLNDIAETLAQTDGRFRPDVMHQIAETHRQRFPNLAVIARTDSSIQTWPSDPDLSPPPEGWQEASGVVLRRGRYYLWSHVRRGTTRITALVPLSRAYLSRMVPGLGDVYLLELSNETTRFVVENGDKKTYFKNPHEPPANPFPPAYNRFDLDMNWFSVVSVWRWDQPGKSDQTLLFVHTRPSAVLSTIFNTKVDTFSGIIPIALLVISILFLLVELAALGIGVSLAHTITRSVHNLYEGTLRVTEGDFSHRIAIYGKDQLAALSSSFNAMTENLEQLLVVSKEKERLLTEINIAREVQNQLYPKVTPASPTLRLTGVCRPARMVSGDYYDYLGLPGGKVALAIGDVAGKGISAALLMATIQAAMRMELRTSRALGAPGGTGASLHIPTSRLVSDLNQQLYATTAPEKYATFFFALYDEASGDLTYTNAGHLPPLLVRKGSAFPLRVSGTVVGAFPSVEYQEDRIRMESGDLLVCYTDGVTEPENEYGEMFGDERLIELLTKHADCEDSKIMSLILDAVHQWTSAAEQPDDMTLLLARKA